MKNTERWRLRRLAVGFSVAAVGVMPAACLDLDEKIVSGVTAEYLATDAGAQDALKASYSYLREWLPRVEHWMSMTQFGTDIWLEGNDGQHKHFNRYDTNLNAGAAYTREVWDAIYEGVNTANTAIERIPATSFDDGTKNRMLAESRFLRGLMYLDLVRHWGDVHLTLEPSVGVVTEATRTPAEDVFAQAVIPDLEFAASTLGDAPANGELGRATKGAANHFLAIAYLTRGATGDYEKAATALEAVINSGQYALEADYEQTFAYGNENSSEIVFAVQFPNDPAAWGFGNRLHLYWGMVYDRDWPWIIRDIPNGRPFRRIRPSFCLLALWDRDVDIRYEASFKTVWFVNNEALPLHPMGDTAIYLPGVDVSNAEIADTRYTLIPPRNYTPEYYPTFKKHLVANRPNVTIEQTDRDFILARLADTRLLLAEALIRAGRPAEALEHVNAVRERAAKPGQQAAMRVTVNQMTLDFILDERARELAGEGSEPRWLTLKRFDKLIDRVTQPLPFTDPYDGNAHAAPCNPDAAANIRDHHLLRPIPSTQIDRSTTPFAQNPGY